MSLGGKRLGLLAMGIFVVSLAVILGDERCNIWNKEIASKRFETVDLAGGPADVASNPPSRWAWRPPWPLRLAGDNGCMFILPAAVAVISVVLGGILVASGDRRLKVARKLLEDERARRRHQQAERLEQTDGLRRRQEVLLELTGSESVVRGDLRMAVRLISQAAATVLEFDRVSIWLLNDNRRQLRCVHLFKPGEGTHTEGPMLRAEEYPRYFELLERDRVVYGVHEAKADPRIQKLSRGDVAASDMASVLDSAIHVDGRLQGFICLESLGKPRSWTADDSRFAEQVAEIIGRAMANVDIKAAQRRLERRVRQLNCYSNLSKLVMTPRITLERIFQDTAEFVRTAYQYPDFTCIRITFDGIRYTAGSFEKTESSQFAEFHVHGHDPGKIEVYYTGHRHRQQEGPFFKEERDLLDVVAERLGSIAELKQTGEQLRLFRDLVERSNDCIFVIETTRGRFLDANERTCRNTGYTIDQLRDMSFKDIEELQTQPVSWEGRIDDLKNGQDAVIDGRLRRRDGSTFWAETSLKYVSFEQHDCIIGIARDVTDRKKAEEVQARLFAEVQQVNQDLKDFAHIVSHDLKAPLRGLNSLAGWIAGDYGDKLGDDGREKIGMMQDQVRRMHGLIDGVLQYSRAGRAEQEPVSVNLNELVQEIIDSLRPPVDIDVRIARHLPTVECDHTRVMQLFQNLVSNAIKYCDKPRGLVTIDCSEEGTSWKFSVSDNGPGIAEKDREKIFRIFETLSSDNRFDSTGVGLAVVKKIVELYGGKVWVESQVSEGSTFYFTLPKVVKAIEKPVYVNGATE